MDARGRERVISYCTTCSRILDSDFEPYDYLDWYGVGGRMYCPLHKPPNDPPQGLPDPPVPMKERKYS